MVTVQGQRDKSWAGSHYLPQYTAYMLCTRCWIVQGRVRKEKKRWEGPDHGTDVSQVVLLQLKLVDFKKMCIKKNL